MLRITKSLLCIFCLCLIATAQQRLGSLRGQVTDELGALVVGAAVTLVAADGSQKTATTNADGVYTINSLAPGAYALRVVASDSALMKKLSWQSRLVRAPLTTCVWS
jgi:hypothetical protein